MTLQQLLVGMGVCCLFLPCTQAYGEGTFQIQTSVDSRGSFLQFDFDSTPDCQHLQVLAGTTASLHVHLQGLMRRPSFFALEQRCIIFTTRSSTSSVWWYLVPPTPFNDKQVRYCTRANHYDTYDKIDGRLNISLSLGFSRVTARLEQTNLSTEPLLPEADVLVWVSEYGDTTWSAMSKDLEKSFATVRADGQQESEAWKVAAVKNSREYETHRLHETLFLARSDSEFLDLLDERLAVAVRDGSPHAIWSVLMGIDHRSHCHDFSSYDFDSSKLVCDVGVYTFPVFRPEIAQLLLEEFAHAKASSMASRFTIPNNNEGKQATSLRRRGHGLILDELGLGALAKQLVQLVLVPLAKVVHPEWASGFIDSYHAFTIHVGVQNSSEENPSSRGDSLPFHMDVCEVSMNICLGATNFTGSSVHFGGVMGQAGAMDFAGKSASSLASLGREVHHIPGRAFLNLCQQFHGTDISTQGVRHTLVVRGLSTKIRRSPGELFYERCMDTQRAGCDKGLGACSAKIDWQG